MSNHLFHTFNNSKHQYVYYWGKDSKGRRLDLQQHMARIGFDSSIIEVDGQFNRQAATDMAKTHAKRFGLPVITQEENLAHMKAINKQANIEEKKITKVLKQLNIPSELKSDLLNDLKGVIENWRGRMMDEL